MRRFLFLIITTLAAGIALPAGTTALLGWTAPSTHVDGTPIAATEITAYHVVATPKTYSGTALTAQAPGSAPGAKITNFSMPGLICGNFDIVVRAITAVDQSDPSSPPTAYATGVTCSTKPNPPTAVTAN